MMSKLKAPFKCSKNLVICYQNGFQLSNKNFGNFYLGPQTSYGNSERILGCQLILIISAKFDLFLITSANNCSANNFSAKLNLILIISTKYALRLKDIRYEKWSDSN